MNTEYYNITHPWDPEYQADNSGVNWQQKTANADANKSITAADSVASDNAAALSALVSADLTANVTTGAIDDTSAANTAQTTLGGDAPAASAGFSINKYLMLIATAVITFLFLRHLKLKKKK